MSVQSLKRRFLVSTALFLSAAPLLALSPAARVDVRMVYSPTIHRTVLFGGSSKVDHGTNLAYELNDTWERTGSLWVQRFPAHNPGKRAAHVMVYDPDHARVLLFGGRAGTTAFNDTWAYQNGDWTKIDTPSSPPARFLAGGAYDTVRHRFVVFGGNQYSAGTTQTSLSDTWEFDGTNWTQTNTGGPVVIKPILVYDAARDQIIMLGLSDKLVTLMYQYDATTSTWKQLTPSTLPACVNEGSAVYDDATQKVFYTGGVCPTSDSIEENMEWDGSNWTKVEVLTGLGRVFGAAMAYDTDRDQVVLFGGANIVNTVRAATFLYGSGIWFDVTDNNLDPQSRSLMVFITDPVNNYVFMFGGLNDETTFSDFWKFQNGHWLQIVNGDEPSCAYPVAAYDTDRQKIVMVCNDSTLWEYDGTAWKQATGSKTAPPARRFSSLVYDQSLKKTVLFGGFDTDYLDQTWTWDGTAWTQVKKNPAPRRDLASMWYDPTLKKTVLYGGLGRLTSTDRLTRFADMWTFDGTAWTELKPSGGTPGARYGAQTAVDPRTNKVVVFGGLRLDVDAAGLQTQVYADDTWEWDGSAWKKLTPDVVPPARENGGLTFDPLRNELVMFSGFSGVYHADTWGYTNGAWHLRIENVTKRRASR